MNKRRLIQAAIASGLLAALGCASAQAPAFPSKPIKIITPFPAGQGPDVLLRLVADKLQAEWGQAVVVENKPGASGFIAFQAAKAAPADGYTLVQMDSFHIGSQPHLFSKLPYDAFRDFDPVTPLVRNHFFIVTAPGARWKSVAELIAAARAKPNGLTYGSWAVASPGHLGGLLLESAAGLKMTHVPYKESSQLYQAVATGEVDWAIGSAASTSALFKAGKLQYLAATSPRRIPGFEQVPTVAEGGGPKGFELAGWVGLLAPKGTPKDIAAKVQAGVAKALKSPDVVERLAQFTYEPYAMPPAQMDELMHGEPKRWGDIIRNAGLKLD